MHHHAVADLGLAGIDAGADRHHLAAGLVPGDDRAAQLDADAGVLAFGGAVEFEVAAAHAGGLDGDDDFARARRRVREFHELDLTAAGEYETFHGIPPQPWRSSVAGDLQL